MQLEMTLFARLLYVALAYVFPLVAFCGYAFLLMQASAISDKMNLMRVHGEAVPWYLFAESFFAIVVSMWIAVKLARWGWHVASVAMAEEEKPGWLNEPKNRQHLGSLCAWGIFGFLATVNPPSITLWSFVAYSAWIAFSALTALGPRFFLPRLLERLGKQARLESWDSAQVANLLMGAFSIDPPEPPRTGQDEFSTRQFYLGLVGKAIQ